MGVLQKAKKPLKWDSPRTEKHAGEVAAYLGVGPFFDTNLSINNG